METPLQIDFQGLEPSAALEHTIREKIDQLDKRFGRIISCRVVVKSPGQHHRQGLYEVHVQMALPAGREVAVGKLPQEDERYTDVKFAVNDTIKRARRQLEEQLERLSGDRKAGPPLAVPITATSGHVARLFDDYGFIETDDGDELYFHRNGMAGGKGFEMLSTGEEVAFAVEDGMNGPQARGVKKKR
ncbi:MAG: HPF/RaiA family ribosome-associated protein [Hyphomicrobiales bacterium]